MHQTLVARRWVPVKISVVDTKWVGGGGRGGRREEEPATLVIEDRVKLVGLREGGRLRGRGGGTGGILVGAGGGGGAIPPTVRQLLCSSLAPPQPVEEKPLLLKESGPAPVPVRGKLPPRGSPPPPPPPAPRGKERVERGAAFIQFCLMSPLESNNSFDENNNFDAVSCEQNLCVWFPAEHYVVWPPATELLPVFGFLPKTLRVPNRDCKSLMIYSVYVYRHDC